MIPKTIYLQLGGEQMITPMPEDFDTLRKSGVITWNDEQVNDSDIEYIRNNNEGLRHTSAKNLIGELKRRLGEEIYRHVYGNDFHPITAGYLKDMEARDGTTR